MTALDTKPSFGTEFSNLRDLFLLRSIAIAGQLLIIWFAEVRLQLELPLGPLAVIVGLQVVWNLVTWLRLRDRRPVGRAEFFLQLLIDVAAVTGLLYFTGGATNPFAWVYLLPLMILTINLPRGYAWAMAGIAIAAYTAMMTWHLPLAGTQGHHDTDFGLHIFGMWFGFVLSAVLMVHFVSHMARNLRQRDLQLATAREKLLRDERLIALGTLAAGAAHELGTPLGTMAILTNDLLHDYPADKDPELHGQLHTLRDQIQRCKSALSVISASSGITHAVGGGPLEIVTFLEELVEQWERHRPDVAVELDLMDDANGKRVLADETLRQAINSILDNAADASPHSVTLQALWDSRELLLRILDRGDGLHPMVSDSIGSPQRSTKEHGLGLGLFLAHSTIQRLGGDVQLFERIGGGVCTEIRLPLSTDEPA